MKLFKLATTLALLALAYVSCKATNPVKSVADHTKASIIRITTESFNDRGFCTGFVVAPKVVLTANHCVDTLMQGDGYEATLIDTDQYFDLAVFSLPNSTKKPLVLRDIPVEPTERVLAVGYAWGWSYSVALDVQVLVPAMRPTARNPVGIITQGGYIHGMSGGPVVDLSGRVVGIVQASNEGVGYGVGTTIIKAFLYNAGIEVN